MSAFKLSLENIIAHAYTEVEKLIQEQSRFSEPFRDRYEHTTRVLNWANRIQEIEGGQKDIITLAVLFHDTGWSETVDHALVGAKLAEKYLVEKEVDPVVVDRITSAVRTHNKRQETPKDLPIENLIVMDADLLDEVGVTTLVWDAMATAAENKPSYTKAMERNQIYFERAQEKAAYLKTEAGMRFYNDRIKMWGKCLNHFRYELGLSEKIAA